MLFADFLRATVYANAASASLLAALYVVLADESQKTDLIPYAFGWWAIAVAIGLVIGRGKGTSDAIGKLLANARAERALPEIAPSRALLNRLWPLLVLTVTVAGLGLLYPELPAVGTGFTIIWALAWRKQASAVKAIEGRDGARFYIDKTSPIAAIKLIRTPGFKQDDGIRTDGHHKPAQLTRHP